MASIKKGSFLLDNITGNLGGLVFRKRNGKTVISLRPQTFTLSKKPECIAARNKFRTTAKLAIFLNKIPLIARIWQASNVDGQYVYHKIIKHNARLVDQFVPTAKNSITPPGYHFKIQDVILHEEFIHIIPEESTLSGEDYKSHIVIVLHGKQHPDSEDFMAADLSPVAGTDISIILRSMEMKQYKHFIIYCAVSKEEDDQLTWSNTHAIEGDFEVYDN